MKKMLTALSTILMISTAAFAGEGVSSTGNVTVYNNESVTEVTVIITGKAAKSLYESLYEGEELKGMGDESAEATQRIQHNLVCTKSRLRKKNAVDQYSCDIQLVSGKALSAQPG